MQLSPASPCPVQNVHVDYATVQGRSLLLVPHFSGWAMLQALGNAELGLRKSSEKMLSFVNRNPLPRQGGRFDHLIFRYSRASWRTIKGCVDFLRESHGEVLVENGLLETIHYNSAKPTEILCGLLANKRAGKKNLILIHLFFLDEVVRHKLKAPTETALQQGKKGELQMNDGLPASTYHLPKKSLSNAVRYTANQKRPISKPLAAKPNDLYGFVPKAISQGLVCGMRAKRAFFPAPARWENNKAARLGFEL